jgi:integrase
MEQIDKFMLQTHLNRLARTLSAGRVMHARFFMKAIFDEAIDQGFVERNPARKLILPKELRPVDRTTLTWDQLRLVLASAPLRDRILLTLDMTETFRPSELFALTWSGFDVDGRMLTVSQTAYRGKLRDYGKTKRTTSLPVRTRTAVNHTGPWLEWKIMSGPLLSGLASESVSAGTHCVTRMGRS